VVGQMAYFPASVASRLNAWRRNLRSYDLALLFGLPVVYATVAILIPPYFPLLQPDSTSYVEFYSIRTALYPLFLKMLLSAGLDLVQITYVQIVLFSLSLSFFLSALSRIGLPRPLIAIFVALLCANVYFTSFHRTILAESLFCSVMMLVIAFLLDFLRSGKSVFLALASLGMGLLVGIRPAAVGLAPTLLLAGWLKGRRRDIAAPILAAAVVVPFAFGVLCEWLAYRTHHGDHRDSVASNHLLGRAAMLARPGVTFTGPHAETLTGLGQKLSAIYEPVHEFLSHVPLPALPMFTAVYEEVGQTQVIQQEIEHAAQLAGVSKEALISDLAKQFVLANITGQMRLFLIQYIGQWSIASLTFPTTARAINKVVDEYPTVPLLRNDPDDIVLHPKARRSSYIIYPAFLAAGLLTLLLTLALGPFLLRPSLAEEPRLRPLFLAAFFSMACQIYTMSVSVLNLATPRYLMAVFPVICLVAVFAVLYIWRCIPSTRAVKP
jgi:hypothetical protein